MFVARSTNMDLGSDIMVTGNNVCMSKQEFNQQFKYNRAIVSNNLIFRPKKYSKSKC